MRILITLVALTFLSTGSIAQNDLNAIVEDFSTSLGLDISRLEKLEVIRTNVSWDSLKREKKWKKEYEKWDVDNKTSEFRAAGNILSSLSPDPSFFSPMKDYPDFSNRYLNYLLDKAEENRIGLTEHTVMFFRNVLKHREDTSLRVVKPEFETIFAEANRFGNKTPIHPDHFAVMRTYLQKEHPELKEVKDFIFLLRNYDKTATEKLIQHADKNGLSLNQLNTIPPLQYYRDNSTIGGMFRTELMAYNQLYRHAFDAYKYDRTYSSAWSTDEFELYHHYLNDPYISNMLIGLFCYKTWLDYEYEKLNSSKVGAYISSRASKKASMIYYELQKSQIKQLRLNVPPNKYTQDPFIELLIAADNGIFFLPTNMSSQWLRAIEKLRINESFNLTKKERTVVDAIGPYRIRHQGERILMDNQWLTEHSKKITFRLAVLLKLAQTAMKSETDWFGKAEEYREQAFLLKYESVEVPPLEANIKKREDRINEIKESLVKGLKELGISSGKYVITCEGRRNVEIYPELDYRMHGWVMGELRRLKVPSWMRYDLPGYSRFIIYIDEKEPRMPVMEEIIESEERIEERHALVRPPSPVPPPRESSRVQQAEIIDFPDVEASFPGGTGAMIEWIKKNLIYPQKAIDEGKQGRVYLSFVVEKTGEISNVKVMRGLSKELDKEAIRLVQAMPRWIPGEVARKKVRMRCRIPITFTFE